VTAVLPARPDLCWGPPDYARERLRGRSGPADDLHCEWSGGGLRTQVDKDAAVERLVELGEVVPTRTTRSPQAIRGHAERHPARLSALDRGASTPRNGSQGRSSDRSHAQEAHT
jgi:hypothetical protein